MDQSTCPLGQAAAEGNRRRGAHNVNGFLPSTNTFGRQSGGMDYARRLKRPKTGGSPPANRSFLPLAAILWYPTNSDAVTWNRRLTVPGTDGSHIAPPESPQTFSPSRDDALVALFRRDALLEQVETGLEHDSRLHDMEIVIRDRSTPARTSARKSACFWLSPSRQTRSPGRMIA